MYPHMKSFRDHHLQTFLDTWNETGGALDASLANYFRTHKALGSKDRAEIAEKVYQQVRWKLLPEGADSNDTTLPAHIRVSTPEELYQAFVRTHGEEKAFDLLFESNFPAPTTVRANLIKTTRDELVNKWKGVYEIAPTEISSAGITFLKKILFFSLPEYKEGLFEVQDEGSQMVAEQLDIKPGDHILDWCAGSGGKTLAFAHKTKEKGQIYLHDIRKGILLEARKRLARAGVQNSQILFADEEKKLAKLKKKMDWVLVDAPCTGTGTLRRNPEMKYRIDEALIKKFVGDQRTIFEKALSFLKPGGKIVWATCSLLEEENQKQVEHFIKTYDLQLVKEPFQSLPARDKMDGLYAAVLERKPGK